MLYKTPAICTNKMGSCRTCAVSGLVAVRDLEAAGEVAEKCESLRGAVNRGQGQQREAGRSPDSLYQLSSLSVMLRLHATECGVLGCYAMYWNVTQCDIA